MGLPPTEHISLLSSLDMPRLNSLPHIIVVYASQWSSPSTTQHSLPGGRYALPGPDLHRLEHASLLGALTAYLLQQIQLLALRGRCGLPPWSPAGNRSAIGRPSRRSACFQR